MEMVDTGTLKRVNRKTKESVLICLKLLDVIITKFTLL